ncbi:MAG: hypothetical protein GY862_26180, partial [Gammaproteobacteria bacterium]|nr:hypothetical protein [Gammaproteobacteria bacterium]
KQEVKTAPADAGVFDSGETFAPATAATTTETVKTADGAREQAVIPGAEKISDKEHAERQMQGGKKARVTQKGADEGLFDTGARTQTDIFDSETKAELPPVEGEAAKTDAVATSHETKKESDERQESLDVSDTELYSVTPAFRNIRGDFKAQAERLFRRIAGDDAKLELRDEIVANEEGARQSGGTAGPAAGFYDPVANLAALSLSYGDPVNTAAHEGWRALKATRFFTNGERKALADGTSRFRKIAEGQGLNPDTMSDESLEAVAFAKWATERTEVNLKIRHAFNRARKFLGKLANWLKVKRITAEDVFEKAYSGEIAKR